MKKNKIVLLYIAVFAILFMQIVDDFFIPWQGTLLGDNVIARIVGIVVAIIASVLMKLNIRNVCFRSYNWLFELIYGIAYAAIPVAIFFGVEYAALSLKGYEHLKLNVLFPNTNDGMSIKGTLLAMGIFAATMLLEAVFKELFFRGLLITKFKEVYSYQKAIVMQALLFTSLIIPSIIKEVMSGELKGENTITIASVALCSILVEFLSGAKWGMYYRVNSTLWMSTADHFVNHMFLQCLYVTYSPMPLKWSVVEALAVQIISILLFLPLYFTRDRINEENAIEAKVQRELAGLHVDNYSPSPIRHYMENMSATRREENARKRNIPRLENMPIPQDRLEEPVSLRDFGLTESNKNTGSSKINIGSFTTSPNEITKAFFEEVKDKSFKTGKSDNNNEQKNDTDFTGGADNISKLVSEYFDNDFKKHTF